MKCYAYQKQLFSCRGICGVSLRVLGISILWATSMKSEPMTLKLTMEKCMFGSMPWTCEPLAKKASCNGSVRRSLVWCVHAVDVLGQMKTSSVALRFPVKIPAIDGLRGLFFISRDVELIDGECIVSGFVQGSNPFVVHLRLGGSMGLEWRVMPMWSSRDLSSTRPRTWWPWFMDVHGSWMYLVLWRTHAWFWFGW